MRQVFRLMDMPDKVIAFDELPKDLLEGFELVDCKKLPREWREFIGIREKITKVPPERDQVTGQVRTYPPIVEKGYYAYVVDKELNNDKEAWSRIEAYVRQNVSKDFRLMDKLADLSDGRNVYMAKPCAPDVSSEWQLEVEDCVVIPLPKPTEEIPDSAPKVLVESFKCDKCEKEFEKKQGLRLHKMKKHPEPELAKV